MQDVKNDYDIATAGLGKAQHQINQLNGAKKVIEDSITKSSDDILETCQEIKGICKGFNFAEEMHILLGQLEAHKTLLTDPYAKNSSQKFIDSIKGIIQSLLKDNEPSDAGE